MLTTPVRAVRALAAELDARLSPLAPQTILRIALEDVCPGRTAVVSSFGADSVALLHMASRIDPAAPVVFLQTGKHFDETLRYREDLARRLGLLNVVDLDPRPEEVAREDPDGGLHTRDPDACCALRKVRPLHEELAAHAAWVTGRRRDQTASRATMPVVEADGLRLKFNPLAAWTADDVDAYIDAHDLPRHPLVPFGYFSIGCAPCTAPSAPDDPRAGRWAGLVKTECGIHFAR